MDFESLGALLIGVRLHGEALLPHRAVAYSPKPDQLWKPEATMPVRTKRLEPFLSLLENSADGHFIAEVPSGRFLYLNQRICEMWGYSMEEAMGLTLWDIVAPEEHDGILRRLKAQMDKEGTFDSVPKVYRILRRDGTSLRGEISASFRVEKGRNLLMGSLRDVTEREQVQEHIQHARRMQAVGTLAAGIAHEFNNILAAIQGYAQLIGMALGEGHPLASYVGEIESSCQRAALLTSRMVMLSRLDRGQRVPLSLNSLVEDVISQLRDSLPHVSSLEVNLSPFDPKVLADPAQMEQVVWNLASNAVNAIARGGTLRIETALVELDQTFCRLNPWAQRGLYAELKVEDTGNGIPPHVLPRIFDPFFTTREPGQGTGLGLSIAYAIVRGHGGCILAQSPAAHGCGTSMRVLLPMWEHLTPPEELFQQPVPESLSGASRGERILIVDDEPQLRQILERAFCERGYRVALAAHGEEAVRLYAEALNTSEPFDLVILDLAMPVMGGKPCLEALLAMDPRAPVIIVTGQWLETARAEELKDKVKAILQKPFRLGSLMEKVQEVLGKADSE